MATPEKLTQAEKTVVQKAHEVFLKREKPATDAEIAAAKKGLLDAEKVVEKAQAALEKAREGRHAAALAMVSAVGSKVRVDLGPGHGVHVVSARGDRMFYRPMGEIAEPKTV